MMKSTRFPHRALTLALAFAVAVAVAMATSACTGDRPASQPPGAEGTLVAATALPGPGIPGVRATTVASQSIERGVSRVVTADGALELPEPPQTLGFPKPGTVREVLVRDGQAVTAGEVLARMDTAPFDLEVAAGEAEVAAASIALKQAQSTAAVDTARQDLERAKNQLWSQQISRDGRCQEAKVRAENDPNRDRGDNDSGITADCDAAKALVQASEASLRVAEINLRTVEANAGDDATVARARLRQAQVGLTQARDALSRAEIKAPFDGAVVTVHIAAGGQTASGPAMTVVRTSPLVFVTSNLSERFIGDVREGAKASVTLTAYPDRTLSATVRHIAPGGTVDVAGGVVFKVYLDLDDSSLAVYAGMTGRVEIDAGAMGADGFRGDDAAAGGVDAGSTELTGDAATESAATESAATGAAATTAP